MAKNTRVRATDDDDALIPGKWFTDMAGKIAIERDALDDCLIQQPQLYYEVSERLALAISRRDAQKDEVKVVESEVDEIVRQDAAEEEKKITEAGVKAQVSQHKDVIAARKTLTRLDTEIGRLSALKEAYSQRSHALRELCGLYAANYWGDGSGGSRAGTDRKSAQYDDNRGALSAARKRSRDQDA